MNYIHFMKTPATSRVFTSFHVFMTRMKDDSFLMQRSVVFQIKNIFLYYRLQSSKIEFIPYEIEPSRILVFY